MQVYTLLDAVETTGAGSSQSLVRGRGPESRAASVVQAVVTGTATVKLQGSLDGTNWFDIAEFSSSGANEFTAPTYIRGNVTARSSGSITLLAEV